MSFDLTEWYLYQRTDPDIENYPSVGRQTYHDVTDKKITSVLKAWTCIITCITARSITLTAMLADNVCLGLHVCRYSICVDDNHAAFYFHFQIKQILMNQIFMSHAYFHSIFLLNSSIFIQLFENLFYHDLNKMSMKFTFSKNKNLLICIHSIKIMISIV